MSGVAVALAAFIVAAAASGAAQGPNSAPSILLARPLSVRSSGLNGAGAALVGNAGAVFSNPAGIATLSHIGVEGSYRAGPSDGNVSSGALGWRLRQFDIGVGIGYLKFGTGAGTDLLAGLPTDETDHEMAGVGSLVYRFGIIAVGGSGKYVERVVGESREHAASADAGLAIAVFDIMAIGFALQNIGGTWGREGTIDLPSLTRVGLMWNYVDPLETFRLMSTVELQWPEGEDFRVVVGGEGGVVVNSVGVFARAGYCSGTTLSDLAYGGSVTVSRFALDYAYQKSDLNSEPAHRFGFRLAL